MNELQTIAVGRGSKRKASREDGRSLNEEAKFCKKVNAADANEKNTFVSVSLIHSLSNDMLSVIFGYFTKKEVISCMRVCRRWRDIIYNTPSIWRSFKWTDIRETSTLRKSPSEIVEKVLGLYYFREHVQDIDIDQKGDACTFAASDIQHVAERCKQLQVLKVNNSFDDDKTLDSLTTHCQYLKHLAFRHTTCFSDVGLTYLSQRLRNMQVLALGDNEEADEYYRDSKKNVLVPLQTRDGGDGDRIVCCRENLFTTSSAQSALQNGFLSTSLQQLILPGYDISNSQLDMITKYCTNLTNLKLADNSSISDEGVAVIVKHCPKLRELDLHFNLNITDKSLEALTGCSSLSKLSISLHGITATGLETFLSQTGSQMELLHMIPGNNAFKAHTVVNIISLLPNVVDLKVSFFRFSNEALTTMADTCSKLQKLCLHACSGLTPGGLKLVLRRCTQLYDVAFNFSYINEELGCSIAENGHALIAINFAEADDQYLTDEVICSISKHCHTLQRVDLCKCSLITDKSALALAVGCPNLLELDMNESKITDLGLSYLANGCKNLHKLDISHCVDVTSEGIRCLARSNQKLWFFSCIGCDRVSYQSLVELDRSCPSLVKLSSKWTICDHSDFCQQVTMSSADVCSMETKKCVTCNN